MSKPYSKSQLRNAKGGQTSVVYVTKRIPDVRVSKTKKAKKIYVDR